MHPTLIGLPFIKIRSYYILWIAALYIFLTWTRKRASENGYTDDEAVSVLTWVYVCGILGALAFGILERLPLVLKSKSFYEFLANGGLSSGGGLLCGGIGGIYRIKSLGRSVNRFSDSTSLPAAALLAVGRLGCFLEGCCCGAGQFYNQRPFWAVHFPFDPPGFYRYPSQLSESAASFIILLILYLTEKNLSGTKFEGGARGAVTLPLFLILYGTYRLIFDRFRVLDEGAVFRAGGGLSLLALGVGFAWLAYTFVLCPKIESRDE